VTRRAQSPRIRRWLTIRRPAGRNTRHWKSLWRR